jgi:hypothetical protein
VLIVSTRLTFHSVFLSPIRTSSNYCTPSDFCSNGRPVTACEPPVRQATSTARMTAQMSDKRIIEWISSSCNYRYTPSEIALIHHQKCVQLKIQVRLPVSVEPCGALASTMRNDFHSCK